MDILIMSVQAAVLVSGWGAFGILYRKTRKTAEPKKWFTVGRWQLSEKFSDTKKPYSITAVLKCSETGERDVELRFSPVEQTSVLREYVATVNPYVLGVEPWRDGMLSLAQLQEAFPSVAIVNNRDLLM
jgi:hypothetical protein